MQHHLVNLLFKDGVYERRKTSETFFHAENRDLEPLEVRAVVTGGGLSSGHGWLIVILSL
jgi:hypothetical protein